MADWGAMATVTIGLLTILGGALKLVHKVLHDEIKSSWEKIDQNRDGLQTLRDEVYRDFTRASEFQRSIDELKAMQREAIKEISQMRDMLITHWAKQRDDGK